LTEIFAHRGSWHLTRENTVPAFIAARELGADGVELDVQLTADGAVVVHHDSDLPGVGPIAALSSKELPDWLPTLGEALEACAPLAVNVEIKDEGPTGAAQGRALASNVAALLSPRREAARIVVSSFSLSAIDEVRACAPSLATALLIDVAGDPMAWLVTAHRHGHGGLHPFFLDVDEALMKAAKASGMAIRAWTVDDPARIAALAVLDVDAVITNDVPAALHAIGRSQPRADPRPPGSV